MLDRIQNRPYPIRGGYSPTDENTGDTLEGYDGYIDENATNCLHLSREDRALKLSSATRTVLTPQKPFGELTAEKFQCCVSLYLSWQQTNDFRKHKTCWISKIPVLIRPWPQGNAQNGGCWSTKTACLNPTSHTHIVAGTLYSLTIGRGMERHKCDSMCRHYSSPCMVKDVHTKVQLRH